MERVVKRDKDIVIELTRRNIKKQYRGSVLGFVWTILNPLLTMLVMWFVFSNIFGRTLYYPIYLLCGNIIFTSLKTATTRSLPDIQNNRNLLLRTKVHPYVFPCSTTLSSVVNFLLSLIALIPFMVWLSIKGGVNLFTYRLLFIILMIPALWLFEYGLSLLLSVLYIFFKDIKNIYQVFVVLWQYLTPTFYTIDRFNAKPGENQANSAKIVQTVIKINPMYQFVTFLRDCTYMGAVGIDPNAPTVIDAAATHIPELWPRLVVLYASAAIMALIGIGVYKAVKEKLIVRL